VDISDISGVGAAALPPGVAAPCRRGWGRIRLANPGPERGSDN